MVIYLQNFSTRNFNEVSTHELGQLLRQWSRFRLLHERAKTKYNQMQKAWNECDKTVA